MSGRVKIKCQDFVLFCLLVVVVVALLFFTTKSVFSVNLMDDWYEPPIGLIYSGHSDLEVSGSLPHA